MNEAVLLLFFFACHAADRGLQHPVVQAVLWCVGSPDSLWSVPQREVISSLPQGVTISVDITPRLPSHAPHCTTIKLTLTQPLSHLTHCETLSMHGNQS